MERNARHPGNGGRGPLTARGRLSWRTALKFFFFLVVLPAVAGAGIGGFLAFAKSVPSILELRQNITPPSTRVFADDDTIVGEFKILKGRHVPLSRIPEALMNAVISVEDSHFWSHSGIDYLAIVRAAYKDIRKRHLKEGGSTITQQLAKMTFLTPEKTFKRKLKEAVLAARIERNLTKEEILELYLNRAYFGHGAYGVEMAARTYFGKSVNELALPEAALIAGLLKAPSLYSPINNFSKAKTRQVTVLRRMQEEGFLDDEKLQEAEAAPVVLARAAGEAESNNYFLEYVKRYLIDKYGGETVYRGGMRVYTTLDRSAQAAAQKAVRKGLRNLDKRRGFRGPIDHREPAEETGAGARVFAMEPPKVGDILEGMVVSIKKDVAEVRTASVGGTLSAEDAQWARLVADEKGGEPRWIQGFSLGKILKPGDVILVMVKSLRDGRAVFSLEQEPQAQGALVAIDPHSGYVRALVGGYDFSRSEYNRALYAERQVGSAFKPIVYALALQSGFTPASVVMDEEVTFDEEEVDEEGNPIKKKTSKEGEEIEPWKPRNYDEEFHGPTRLRDALAFSRNVVTVKLVDAIGIGKMIAFARKVGVTSKMHRDLTIALGSVSITPLELTSVFSAFANEGVKMKPIGIKYITDNRGKVIESNEPEGHEVLDKQTSYLITSMLKDVVNYGTGWRARELRVPVAGKTGTTNEYMDAWFLGYTTDIVAGVWVGFDEPTPLGQEETGSRAAAPVWVDFMKAVTDASNAKDFPVPEGIVTRLIDPETGLLANMWTSNARVEYFKEGTEPREFAPSIWDFGDPELSAF